jgi:hypothetical protein
VDGERAVAAVRSARASSMLGRHPASMHATWSRPGLVHHLHLFGGRTRNGNVAWAGKQRGDAWRTVDLLATPAVDVDAPGVATSLLRDAKQGRIRTMHAGWDCATWSPALSLPIAEAPSLWSCGWMADGELTPSTLPRR